MLMAVLTRLYWRERKLRSAAMNWSSSSGTILPRHFLYHPALVFWTVSRSVSASPTRKARTMCRCWFHRGPTLLIEAARPTTRAHVFRLLPSLPVGLPTCMSRTFSDFARHAFRAYRNGPITVGHSLLKRTLNFLLPQQQDICLRSGLKLRL